MILKRVHPKTGDPVLPLYVRLDGSVVWPVMGASPDDPNDGGSGDGEPNDSGGTGGTGSTGSEGGTGTEGGDKPVSRAEFERLQQHLSAADKKRTEAEAKLKEIEDSKKDELTKATERADELQKTVEQQKADLAALRLDNAFLSVNEVTWHDKEDAMLAAQRGGYLEGVVGEDGKVDQKLLAKKLGELAKAKPHLVKAGTEKKNEPLPPSGGAVGSGGGAPKDNASDEAKRKARYGRLYRD